MSDHHSQCPTCGHVVGGPRCDECKDTGYVSTLTTSGHSGGIVLKRCPCGCTGPIAINAGSGGTSTWIMSAA
jgi:hypothetical protein